MSKPKDGFFDKLEKAIVMNIELEVSHMSDAMRLRYLRAINGYLSKSSPPKP